MQEAGFEIEPYHAYVPSFGDWGFTLASHTAIGEVSDLPDFMRYYSLSEDKRMREFPEDMKADVAIVNRLENQALVQLFQLEWRASTDD